MKQISFLNIAFIFAPVVKMDFQPDIDAQRDSEKNARQNDARNDAEPRRALDGEIKCRWRRQKGNDEVSKIVHGREADLTAFKDLRI